MSERKAIAKSRESSSYHPHTLRRVALTTTELLLLAGGLGAVLAACNTPVARAPGKPHTTETPTTPAEKAAISNWMNGKDTYASEYFKARDGSTPKAGTVIEWQITNSVPTAEDDPNAVVALTNPIVIFADENDTILGFVSDTGQKGWTITATANFVGNSMELDSLFENQNSIDRPTFSQIVDALQTAHHRKSTIGLRVTLSGNTDKISAFKEFMKTGKANDYFATTTGTVPEKQFTPDAAILPYGG